MYNFSLSDFLSNSYLFSVSINPISLKKSGAVFLANKGWAKESQRLLEELKPTLSPEAYTELEKSMSIKSYNDSLNKRYLNITKDMDSNYINGLLGKLQDEDEKTKGEKFVEQMKGLFSDD